MKREKTRISSWKRTEAGSVGFRVGSVRALIADIARLLRYVRLVPILLKKSPLAHERNFSAPLVRPTLGDVRDHIDSRKSDQ
jgi:hypothetical protein